MATRVKSASSTASKIRIHYHSAIGTHRLKPRPLKNILYPYYRNYKPVYRARNPRTPRKITIPCYLSFPFSVMSFTIFISSRN